MNDKNNNLKVRDEAKGQPMPAPVADDTMLTHIRVSVVATIALAIIVCGIYPLVVWGLSQAIFRDKANGSLITDKDGKVVGSKLIGQAFSDGKYFHGRPSAAGSGYDPTASGGSNLGPTSAKLLLGTTKDSAFTILSPDAAVPGRVEGTFVASDGKTITVALPGAAAKTVTYKLDPAVVVTAQGRTLSKTTPAKDANVELKLGTGTPSTVTAITVIDKVVEGVVVYVDTSANKIRIRDPKGGDPTDYAVASSAVVVVNGKADAKFADVPLDAKVRILTATVVDNDGIADRVIHYCEDNSIAYTSAVPVKAFKDDDGIDDVKLITAFNAAKEPKDRVIAPTAPIPADAVTASGSGLDPHISVENAALQAKRVADARGISKDEVMKYVAANTDGPYLGILGDAGVNVLQLNLALDKDHPAPAPAAKP